ncbi:ExbD/TolR family protein [Pseudomarimonas salicorniae]|uniref:Biopolymer transporter ExbD n=1 Tax=Pseudomarimonas salicorniae TaxID=2933270 RepID=A0ABT0GEI3_9GAMM|nr:biopolymer transporter ExbD [Lysobacter sp. CAU 1642]MCK7592960.1 biopolymer transporter ExbD [Lysobacter sp. CAU 1642]
MNFRTGRLADEPEISLTSLIDVVFTLIIFFVVTTTFDERSSIQIDLPKASTEASAQAPQPLTLAIDPQGRYYLGNEEVLKRDADSLRQAIQQVAGESREQPVVVRADARTPHQAVITALDVLGQLGFSRISIATVGAADEAGP